MHSGFASVSSLHCKAVSTGSEDALTRADIAKWSSNAMMVPRTIGETGSTWKVYSPKKEEVLRRYKPFERQSKR